MEIAKIIGLVFDLRFSHDGEVSFGANHTHPSSGVPG